MCVCVWLHSTVLFVFNLFFLCACRVTVLIMFASALEAK